MKILKNIYTKILMLTSLLAIGTLNSCKVDPNEGIDLRVDWNIIETTASFQFVDAKTGELVGYENGDKIEIIVKGNNKEVVVDITGKKTDDFEAVKGSLNLALDPNAPAPSEDQPVDFTVTAMIDGYVTIDYPVQIFRTGAHEYEVKMINLENTPEGVIVTTNQSFELQDGATTETVMVNVSNPNGMEAEVIIPEGTIIKDKDGNLLEGPIRQQ